MGGWRDWHTAGVAWALITVALVGPGLARPALAQERVEVRLAGPGEIQELHLADGSTLIGRVIEVGDPIRFELSSGGIVEIRRAQIRGLRTVEGGEVHDGEVWTPDPSPNRLFFGPTGRTIGKGRGNLAVFEVLFPSVSVGLHDRVTIGVGTLLVGNIDDSRPFWLVPKVKVLDEGTMSASVGALAITSLEGGSVGLLYGVATFGSSDRALTAGLAYGWVEDDLADTPAILLGGETRASRHVKLITENYVIPTGDGDTFVLLSAGPRFFGEQLSADLGIAVLASAGGGFFPLVNFVYNW